MRRRSVSSPAARQLLSGLLAVALCATVSACGSSPPPSQSPKNRLASILRSVRAQRSVHYTTSSSLGYTATADVARGRGIEHLAFHYGKRHSSLTVILAGGVAYVRGDAGGLESLSVLSGRDASRYAGRWIAIPAG